MQSSPGPLRQNGLQSPPGSRSLKFLEQGLQVILCSGKFLRCGSVGKAMHAIQIEAQHFAQLRGLADGATKECFELPVTVGEELALDEIEQVVPGIGVEVGRQVGQKFVRGNAVIFQPAIGKRPAGVVRLWDELQEGSPGDPPAFSLVVFGAKLGTMPLPLCSDPRRRSDPGQQAKIDLLRGLESLLDLLPSRLLAQRVDGRRREKRLLQSAFEPDQAWVGLHEGDDPLAKLSRLHLSAGLGEVLQPAKEFDGGIVAFGCFESDIPVDRPPEIRLMEGKLIEVLVPVPFGLLPGALFALSSEEVRSLLQRAECDLRHGGYGLGGRRFARFLPQEPGELASGVNRMAVEQIEEYGALLLCRQKMEETLQPRLFFGLRWALRPAFKADYAQYLKFSRNVETLLNEPHFIRLDTEEYIPPVYAVLTSMLAPSINSVFTALAAESARRGMAATALALEDYRERHGSYPRSLAELPQEFQTAAIDPCSGQFFRFNSDGESFRLYSLGINQTDDEGTPATTLRSGDGDIVWKRPRR